MKTFKSLRTELVHSADKKPQVYRDPEDGKTKTRMVPVDKEVVKTNEVSAKTLGNYMRKSTADAGKPNTSARQQDKRIGGQKMADDKMRKAQGKGSAAKVAATESFEPHMMYDPKTGKGTMAKVEADHIRMKKMGYTHDKPND